MKSMFEEMGGTDTQVGDFLLPNLYIESREEYHIGKYGRIRKRYLKVNRTILFSNLLLSGKLDQRLSEIDRACADQVNSLTRQMAKQEGVTEKLKAADQMEWVRQMNNIQNRAEEIVLNELVYD